MSVGAQLDVPRRSRAVLAAVFADSRSALANLVALAAVEGFDPPTIPEAELTRAVSHVDASMALQ
eukprot:SAG31_NODE_15622_length_746_cov_1.015456_1_plen_64_part_01